LRRVVFLPASTELWALSPPAHAQLLADLADEQTRAWLRVSVDFTRDHPAAMRTVSPPPSELELVWGSAARGALAGLLRSDAPYGGVMRVDGIG
jgi:hypothetical protein